MERETRTAGFARRVLEGADRAETPTGNMFCHENYLLRNLYASVFGNGASRRRCDMRRLFLKGRGLFQGNVYGDERRGRSYGHQGADPVFQDRLRWPFGQAQDRN